MERADGGRVVLCVLCGLPAAGKSTLARALRRQLPLRQGWDCALLVYDDLIPEEAWGRGEPPDGEPPLDSAWKRRRRELLRHLERLLRALRSHPAPPGPAAAPPSWGRFLSCCAEQGLLPGRGGGPGTRPLCLVLDDNFYYRSMRHEVFQLARKFSTEINGRHYFWSEQRNSAALEIGLLPSAGSAFVHGLVQTSVHCIPADSLGFCQLFLECPLELCLQRNRLRGSPVPEGTICRMAQRVEVPEPEKNPWEQNSLVLSSSACAPEEQCDSGLMEAFHVQIINLLGAALENPVKQNEENTEQKEADRAICAASTVHQADQTCRRIISQTMKEAKDKNVLPSEMKSLAEELNKLKAEFLEDLRQGSHVGNESGQQNPTVDPAASVLSSFQPVLLKTSKSDSFLRWRAQPPLTPARGLWNRDAG
ncbi:L-seryl-tRNA(Sec) kinase isoform X1 [Gallus gallus]|uniref:L-seryl-tRNA(Sec) kinase isoform X1 n=1 Tax=Gallus gallus TaxID=9031 RepID=UPI001AE8B7E7|nr:L-seryl-tRNA(Sec) kinase isoform X1 [Gallus gallus]